jgi:hypothetical protein
MAGSLLTILYNSGVRVFQGPERAISCGVEGGGPRVSTSARILTFTHNMQKEVLSGCLKAKRSKQEQNDTSGVRTHAHFCSRD